MRNKNHILQYGIRVHFFHPLHSEFKKKTRAWY